MNHELLVEEYIKSKKNAWARSSQKNERYRLMFHGGRVLDNPDDVYERLKGRLKHHSIKTTFVRLGQFFDYLVETDKSKYQATPSQCMGSIDHERDKTRCFV